jgi:hypothetical protein
MITPKTCGGCGRSFTKTSHLLRHARSHARDRPFRCSSCDKAFARTDALHRHERTVHSSDRPLGESSTAQEPGQATATSTATTTATMETDIMSKDPTTTTTEAPFFVISVAHRDQNGLFPEMELQSSSSSSAPLVGMSGGGQVLSSTGLPFPGAPLSMSSVLASFPSPVPSREIDLDDLIGDWFVQDGGALAAENALTDLFSEQMQPQPVGSDVGSSWHWTVQSAPEAAGPQSPSIRNLGWQE